MGKRGFGLSSVSKKSDICKTYRPDLQLVSNIIEVLNGYARTIDANSLNAAARPTQAGARATVETAIVSQGQSLPSSSSAPFVPSRPSAPDVALPGLASLLARHWQKTKGKRSSPAGKYQKPFRKMPNPQNDYTENLDLCGFYDPDRKPGKFGPKCPVFYGGHRTRKILGFVFSQCRANTRCTGVCQVCRIEEQCVA